MKKRLSLILAIALIFSLFVGCSTPAEEAPGESTSTNSTVSENNNEESSSTTDTTLTILIQGVATENDFETGLLPDLIATEFPGVSAEVTKMSDEQFLTTLRTRLASGEAPDLFSVQPRRGGANGVVVLAQAGYLESLSDLDAIKMETEPARADMSYNGEVYAVSTGTALLGTWYNKDMFADNGLEFPTNWEDFLTACQTLLDAGIQPIVMGDKDMGVIQFGLYQVAANQVYPGNVQFDEQLFTGETKFTDEDTWDTVISMYKELYDRGFVDPNSLGLSQQQSTQKFIDGEAAMTFDGSWSRSAVSAEGAADFERGFAPLPANLPGEDLHACIAGAQGLSVYVDSENKELGKQIIESWYGGSSDIYNSWVETSNPAVSWGPAAEKIEEIYMPFFDLYNDNKAFYFSNQGWLPGTDPEMTSRFSEIIGQQGTTVEDVTGSMQSKFEELLAAQ